MTRQFDKPRRDNTRPPARYSSSNRYENERSSRPARPGPDRDQIERPQRNGMAQNRADNRPRNRYPEQPSRQNHYQPSDRPSAQQGRKPYENRQGSYRENYASRPDRPYAPTSNQGPRPPRPRPSGPDRERRNFGGQGYDQRGQNRRPYADRSDNARPYGNRPGPHASRSEHRPDFSRSNRPSRSHDRNEGRPDFSRGNQSFRPRERNERDTRSGGGRPYRGGRSEGGNFRRDTDNPRGQSRPGPRRDAYARRSPERDYTPSPEEELFEGDYERFDAYDTPRRPPQRRERVEQDNHTEEQEERHVTRLPDGRVLKGPRPVQRKNAEFWTEVAQETGEILSKTTPQPESHHGKVHEQAKRSSHAKPQKEAAPERTVKTVKTPPARNSSASARVRKTRAARKNVAPSGTKAALRPSQRGFKWPTPPGQ